MDYKFLTTNEYAKQVGVESVTIRQWIRRGKLKNTINICGRYLIPSNTPKPERKPYTKRKTKGDGYS